MVDHNVKFPSLGLTMAAIEDFMEQYCGGELELGKNGTVGWVPDPANPDGDYIKNDTPDPALPMTTDDVNIRFQKPLTEALQLSYCELLERQGSPHVGVATVFISHAWKYSFREVVKVLRYYFRDEPGTFIWFDLFSNNQHEAVTHPFLWWQNTFMEAIRKMGRVVQILSPWDKPIPFTRAWCLWEIYCAEATGSSFDVAITPDQQEAFVSATRRDTSKYLPMLADIAL